MPWFKRSDGSFGSKDEHKDDDIEFKPEKLKEDIEASFKTKMDEMQTANDAKMKPLLDMAANLEADRAARAEAQRVAAANKNKEDDEIKDEDWLLDPEKAVEKKLSGTNQAVMMLAARQARREVLENEPYYYDEIKRKVDAMIDAQPLKSRMDSSVITNCYKLVMYDHQKDIADGKLRTKNSALVFQSNGTGGHSGKDGGDVDEVLTNEEKHAASALGLSEVDWKKSKKELTYV